MAFSDFSVSQIRWRKGSWRFLAFFWICGVVSGVWIYAGAGSSVSSLMRSIPYGAVSIVRSLSVAIVPFLLSAIAVFLSCPLLLLPISFCDGFLYGFISLAALCCFGSAGWLVRLLLCFTIITVAPLNFWFRLRHISGERAASKTEILFFLSLCILVGSIDYSCISPLLAMLLLR